MTNQYLWTRITGQDPSLRASDADRERVAERLRTSHAEGRLDITEFQQRIERCYEAKTYAELGGLVGDLPRQDEQPHRRAFARSSLWGWRAAMLLVGLFVISAAAGTHHHFTWLWIPLLFIFWRLSWSRRRRWQAGPRGGSGQWI